LREECLCLECRVEVVRVDHPDGSTHYGLGCRIDDYYVSPRAIELPRTHRPYEAATVHEPAPLTAEARFL